MSGSGNYTSEFPIKKWPGVREERSRGSVDRGVSGHEFKYASICTNKV